MVLFLSRVSWCRALVRVDVMFDDNGRLCIFEVVFEITLMKRLFSIFVGIMTMLSAWADDGGSFYPDNWTYGNIYVKEPNQSISLEKEYMEVFKNIHTSAYGNHVKAVFVFRNNTDSTVVVPCAFPVVINVPWRIEKGDSICGNAYTEVLDNRIYNMFFGKDIEIYERDMQYIMPMTVSEAQEYDKKLRVMTYSDYKEAYSNTVLEHHLVGERRYYGCDIEQDGEKVELKNVGIETNFEVFGDKHCEFTTVLHFYHELVFEPNETSKVVVEYDVNSYSGCYDYGEYNFYYDISTGGTWKDGEIGSFVLVTDDKMDVDDVQLRHDDLMHYSVFSARHYKPKGYFKFSSQEDSYLNVDFPRVKSKRNKEKFYLVDKDKDGEYEVKDGKTITFDPSFVTGKISFKLDKPCYGPFFANGYVDVKVVDENANIFDEGGLGRDGYEYLSQFKRDSLWYYYGRAKKVRFGSSEEEWGKEMYLGDIYPAYPYEESSKNNDGWYAAHANYVADILRPGRYEISVIDKIRGLGSDTVGISRIWFYPVSQSLCDILDADSQSEMAIFAELPQVVNKVYANDEKPIFEEDEKSYSVIEKADNEEEEGDTIWLLIGILTGIVVGSVLYFMVRKKK